MPGIIPASRHKNMLMTDGDFSNRLPINKLLDTGVPKIIAVDL
jgi:predicted acylesterase/phospholipase RssA